jgi:hypothetical protein
MVGSPIDKIPITDEEIRIHGYTEWIWEEM